MKLTRYWKLVLALVIVIVFFNVIAFWTGFSDFYRLNIYKPVSVMLSRLTSVTGFALGEICMYLGILMVVLSIIFGVCGLFLKKGHRLRQILRKTYKIELIIVLFVLLSYTFMWSIPLRASGLSFDNAKEQYDLDEVCELRNYLLEQMEQCAREVQRDGDSQIIFDDNLAATTKVAFTKLSEEYPLFSGYMPTMKKALCSDFLEWMRIGGYTYPFTMEITYNKYATRFEYSILYSHEMAHHNGYYRENEAEFLGLLTMIKSDSALLRYAGYKEAYYWMNDAFLESLIATNGEEEAFRIYNNQPMPSKLIIEDNARNFEEYQQHYNKEVNEALEQAVSTYVENVAVAGWEAQANMLGEACYDGVVKLLLDYYNEVGME